MAADLGGEKCVQNPNVDPEVLAHIIFNIRNGPSDGIQQTRMSKSPPRAVG